MVLANENTEYYKVLGIEREATGREVRKAFRKLSVQYHPDKNPGDEEAADKYMQITEAYEVLSDSNKRQIYDNYGIDGLKNND
jgi:DnaJ-class molecular chaperone